MENLQALYDISRDCPALVNCKDLSLLIRIACAYISTLYSDTIKGGYIDLDVNAMLSDTKHDFRTLLLVIRSLRNVICFSHEIGGE